MRHGISRRIRAQHPTLLMRVCIRKSSYSMPQLINQAINQQDRNKQQLACRSGNEPARTHALAESNTISSKLAPHAYRPLESGQVSHCPIDAMRRLASQPRSVRYGIPRRMRAQHQTTMTVHVRVRKLNRGMNNNQSTIKQNNKSRSSRPVSRAVVLPLPRVSHRTPR